jgi:hypothetical protein
MSTWISLVGGIVNEWPGSHELEVRSSKRTPNASRTSAWRAAWFA